MVYTPSFQPINYPIPIYKWSSIQSSSILPPSWTSSPSISIWWHIGPAMVGSIAFKVRSYTPWQIQNLIELEMYSWNKNYEDIPQVLRVSLGDRTSITPFYKLFAATMQLTNGENKLIFGQIQNLIFERRTYPFINNLPLNALQDMATNYKDYFIPSWGGYIFSNKAFSWSPESIRFIPEQTSKTIGDAGIKASPNMTYNLDGKRVEYPLSSDFKNYDPITLTGGAVNRIYIFGNLSSKGKETYVNDVSSITKMNFATLSNIVRKQSALLTRARNPDGSIINDVKYVKGDISLSGDDYQWKTLIVLDGNISFIGNFNSQKKNIGIISIRSIPSDLSKGNIYIKPNVVYIFGTIFAEWSVESVNGDGTVFPLSDINRTKNLQNQIILWWWLYTRNTIGGAILWASTAANYMLPGNRSTANISEAVKFDLSFLRMNNVGYDMPLNKNYNQWRVESVVIIPSSESLMNPPPGFAISKQ